MSARTGLGVLDVAILEACDRLGAAPKRPYLKSARILEEVYAATGIGPRIAYEPLCDLARPFRSHLLLIDFHGNVGSPDFEPAAPRYTEARLTSLGAAALAAERGEIGPLPIALINGDIHAGGHRPPLDPRRVVTALNTAVTDDSADVSELVGLPAFPTGCIVEVADPAALAAGQPTTLTVSARLHVEGSERLIVSCLPPGSSAGRITEDIWQRMQRHRAGSTRRGPNEDAIRYIVDVNDNTTESGTSIEIRFTAGADADAVTELLRGLWAIRHAVEVGFDVPLHTRIVELTAGPGVDLAERLRIITAASRTPL